MIFPNRRERNGIEAGIGERLRHDLASARQGHIFTLHAEAFRDDIAHRKPGRQGTIGVLEYDLHVAPQRPHRLELEAIDGASQEDDRAFATNEAKEGKAERDEMMKLAKMHRDLAKQAKRIHDEMAKQGDLPSGPHDQKAMEAMGPMMTKMVQEQREFATMLQKGADDLDGGGVTIEILA